MWYPILSSVTLLNKSFFVMLLCITPSVPFYWNRKEILAKTIYFAKEHFFCCHYFSLVLLLIVISKVPFVFFFFVICNFMHGVLLTLYILKSLQKFKFFDIMTIVYLTIKLPLESNKKNFKNNSLAIFNASKENATL